MREFLIYYQPVATTTWVYLSSLLMIGLFFKFGRFWSVRNLDLVLLILLAPGLVLVHFGRQLSALETASAASASVEEVPSVDANVQPAAPPGPDQQRGQAPGDNQFAGSGVPTLPDPLPPRAASQPEGESSSIWPEGTGPEAATDGLAASVSIQPGAQFARWGYLWLFCAGVLLLVRLLVDCMMVRRPLLVPNLSVGGMTFIGCSLYIFLMANVIVGAPRSQEIWLVSRAAAPLDGDGPRLETSVRQEDSGPGYAVLNKLPSKANKVVVVLSHLAVVLGMVLIGYWHFDNITMGIGAATLYLMLPYTEQMTGRVDHVLPAALLVWAVLCYPRPLLAGVFLGLAAGVVYYPLFLLPLWVSFYSRRGLWRFSIGVVSMLVLLATILAFRPSETSYLSDLQRMFGLWSPRFKDLDGIWNTGVGGWDPHFRLPILALFVALCAGLALWPAQKNLGTLLSCSAAVMLATQFWHGFGGGIYMAWYLPLTLLTIFRPNLEDRVALTVLEEGWFPRRRGKLSSVGKAA